MLLMDYPYTIGEYFPDDAKEATCNLLHAYIYAHSKILIDEHPMYGVHAISILKS